jgi:DNA-binding CsgD family transcriptional regulator
MIITDERKKRVIDLYFNEHKTYAEIAEIEHISPRDIHTIIKEEQARRQKYQHQQQEQELSSKAYKLFSEGKRPVQVAITLNLGEPEVTKLYREYWKLKRLHKLNSIYEEIGDDIRHIIEIYRRAKKEGQGIEHIVKLLQLANEDNASGILQLERRRKWMIDEIHDLDTQIESSQSYLYRLNNEIYWSRNYWNS